MSTQQTSRIFRIFSALAVLVLVFSQFVGVAQAEGPTPPQLPAKEALNLDEVQGYYYYKPMTGSQFDDLLRDSPRLNPDQISPESHP